jgi:hypothetical protein
VNPNSLTNSIHCIVSALQELSIASPASRYWFDIYGFKYVSSLLQEIAELVGSILLKSAEYKMTGHFILLNLDTKIVYWFPRRRMDRKERTENK